MVVIPVYKENAQAQCLSEYMFKVLRILELNLNTKPHKVRTESNPTHVKSNTPGMKKLEKGEFFKNSLFICNKEPSDLYINRNPPIDALIPRNKCKK